MLAKALTTKVYQRDGWKCRHCGDRNALHPHHVVYKSHQGPDTLENLLSLCAQCHNAHHAGRLAIHIIEIVPGNVLVRFERLKGWRPQ